jgi:hypothetical protein
VRLDAFDVQVSDADAEMRCGVTQSGVDGRLLVGRG